MKYWGKTSRLVKWKTRVNPEVKFLGEHEDVNSANYLDNALELSAVRTNRTGQYDIDHYRKDDIDYPMDLSKVKKASIIHDLHKQGTKDRCVACNVPITWKNPQLLAQFISPFSGRMYEKGVTNLCDKAYSRVRNEIKHAVDNGTLGRNYHPPEYRIDPNLSTNFMYSSIYMKNIHVMKHSREHDQEFLQEEGDPNLSVKFNDISEFIDAEASDFGGEGSTADHVDQHKLRVRKDLQKKLQSVEDNKKLQEEEVENYKQRQEQKIAEMGDARMESGSEKEYFFPRIINQTKAPSNKVKKQKGARSKKRKSKYHIAMELARKTDYKSGGS